MPDAVAAAPPSPLVLGRYRPLKPLGTGGSGSVWLALDETSGLEVALKIVRREGKAAARAEREAEAAARLRHDRCLRAYAFGSDERHAYIAYEYAPGRTLREAMRAAALDDRSAVEAGAQMLEGLAHAHARGVVHRDVKPANVLLVEGDELSIRLLDFGLASMTDADTLTATGDVPGTLAYIAPERLAGNPAGPPADVWGVGVVLWESLAGVHPFWRPSPLETGRAIEAGAPPLANARPDLPKALLAAVDAALAVDPARRPSAAELADALRFAFRSRERAGARRAAAPSLPPEAARAAGRAVPAVLAALAAAWGASALPFYPHGGAAVLALVAGGAALARPRAGLAVALAAPALPLGNVSLGLALVYAAIACAWLGAVWREPRTGLLPALGPLVAPIGGLGLLPLALAPVRSPLRRAFHAAAAVVLAALAAGLKGAPLPLTHARPPLGLGIAGSERPLAVAEALGRAAAAQPVLLAEAGALALAAALLPLARSRGRWGIAVLAAAMIAATVLPLPAVSPAALVLAAWATFAVLGVSLGSSEHEHRSARENLRAWAFFAPSKRASSG